MATRLQEKYKNEVVPELMKIFSYKNPLEAPRLKKIVLNMGVGEAITDPKLLDKAMEELGLIAGQKPVVTRSKKAIANFKIRKGLAIGCFVTLRRRHMYEFMDRLVSVALPRIRDFRGLNPEAFDKNGNYTMGVTEQAVFPEIDVDKVSRVQGMDITFVIASGSPKESYEFLRLMGMPFKTDKS
ncbi:MAG: 50S ribosomal protein L5 [Deltaproteobacteria bacterium]